MAFICSIKQNGRIGGVQELSIGGIDIGRTMGSSQARPLKGQKKMKKSAR